MRWWHQWVLRHRIVRKRVGPPLWAAERLYACSCGKEWPA